MKCDPRVSGWCEWWLCVLPLFFSSFHFVFCFLSSSLTPSLLALWAIAHCHLTASISMTFYQQKLQRRHFSSVTATKFQFSILSLHLISIYFNDFENTRKWRSWFKFNGFMTVNASSNVWFAHRGRSSVTMAAYRMWPCIPSKDVGSPYGRWISNSYWYVPGWMFSSPRNSSITN